MKRPETDGQQIYFETKGESQEFFRQRWTRFGLSMITLGICFPLYYLGLFGNVDGPLNPAHLGERLASMGVSKAHMQVFFLFFLIFTITWNWVYNLVRILIGSSLTCNRPNGQGTPCGAPVRRSKVIHKKTGVVAPQYVCTQGHKRPEAHFHPVKKGTFSHTLWVISLLFCIMVFLLS